LEIKPLLDTLFRDALKAALRRNRMPFNISIVSFPQAFLLAAFLHALHCMLAMSRLFPSGLF
jgi:hypothetical protein